MRKYLADIKEKTSCMSRRDAWGYVFTYYWYHMAGCLAVIVLLFLFAGHYFSGNEKVLFTCVLVNQETDAERESAVRDGFAGQAGLPAEGVVVDSDYHFSYGQFRLESVNESSYEKFFLKWRNGEIDAVILSEDFYEFCKEMGGSFYEVNAEKIEKAGAGWEGYMDGGSCRAVWIGSDRFAEAVTGEEEKLLLAFPESGEKPELCESFLEYLGESGFFAEK